MSRGPSRRDLLGIAAAGLLAGRARPGGAAPSRPGVVGTARLDAAAVDRGACSRAVTGAVCAAVGVEPVGSAMSALFSSSDVVGIKVNCLGGPRLSPRLELVSAFADLLAAVGVDRRRIIVFDRSRRELERAGYGTRRVAGRFTCTGIDNDYEREVSTSGQIGSCFARLVAITCTALVSFGVVKDHDLAGVSAGLKNWYGVIHNPNKYHDSGCDPFVADVVRHPYIRSKLRLTVLDGVEGQCHGGPALSPSHLFPLGTVAASTDPVAADLWAWQAIEAERERRGLPSLTRENRAPRFIATAAAYGLGVGTVEQLRTVAA